MKELLEGKELTFRWDLLHLINRAHVPARGRIDDEDELFDLEDSEEQVEDAVERLP